MNPPQGRYSNGFSGPGGRELCNGAGVEKYCGGRPENSRLIGDKEGESRKRFHGDNWASEAIGGGCMEISKNFVTY